MISELTAFYVAVALMTVGILYVGIYLVRSRWMFAVIPFMIGSAITSYVTLESILGYPVRDEVPEESLYISHLSLENEIVFWLLIPGENEPKAIKVPATDEQKQKAQKAQKKTEGGIPQVMRRKKRSTEVDMFEFYDFQVQRGVSKDSR